MNEIPLPGQLAQAIHEYLMGRPMREVEHLVAGLRQCAPAEQGNTASDRRAEKAGA